jgi:hypothetical protein
MAAYTMGQRLGGISGKQYHRSSDQADVVFFPAVGCKTTGPYSTECVHEAWLDPAPESCPNVKQMSASS